VHVLDLVSDRYRTVGIDPERSFERDGYLKLPAFLEKGAREDLERRIARLRDESRRRDFVMPGAETRRHMSTIGGRRIRALDPALAETPKSPALRRALRSIVGPQVFDCQHPEEFVVANFLTGVGDLHGWHLDDPTYILVMFVEAPEPEMGGLLELVPDWVALRASLGIGELDPVEPGVAHAESLGLVRREHHAPGDAYLLHGARNLHQVAPLRGAAARSVLIFSFQDTARREYGTTADSLYGEPLSADGASAVIAAGG
jgi:hypothetical protein